MQRNYANGDNLVPLIKDLEWVNYAKLALPNNPTNRMEVLLWQEEQTKYMKDKQLLESNGKKAYTPIKHQCLPKL